MTYTLVELAWVAKMRVYISWRRRLAANFDGGECDETWGRSSHTGHINVDVRRQHVDTLTKTNWPRRRKLRAMEMMVGDFSAKTRQIDFTPRQCPERWQNTRRETIRMLQILREHKSPAEKILETIPIQLMRRKNAISSDWNIAHNFFLAAAVRYFQPLFKSIWV